MIVTRTPFRASFMGGGSDYPLYYRHNPQGGAVLATTINKYCWIMANWTPLLAPHKYKVVYSQVEECDGRDSIRHAAVRACLEYLGIDRGICIYHHGDLPARSGVGSSSAFVVGLLNSLYGLLGRREGHYRLMSDALYVEQELLKENVGSQDQAITASGGFRYITFSQDGLIESKKPDIAPERLSALESWLMLFFTGVQRTASDVAATYLPKLESGWNLSVMHRIRESVEIAIEELHHGDFEEFGRLLDEVWTLKKRLGGLVTTPVIDEMYNRAKSAGAFGKLIGAGGGGFLLLCAEPSRQAAIRDALKNLREVPFRFEQKGSKIVYGLGNGNCEPTLVGDNSYVDESCGITTRW